MTHPILSFLDSCASPYHAVKAMEGRLCGYEKLSLSEHWSVKPGGKYYLTVNDSTLIAFRIPGVTPTGFLMAAAHTDSPTFKLKPHASSKDGCYQKLNVEPYGGMILSTWLDRPLTVAGRLLVKEGGSIRTRLVCPDEDLLVIPSLAPHLHPEVNTGYALKQNVDMVPFFGCEKDGSDLMELLAEAAGVKKEQILSHDLFLTVRTKATLAGSGKKLLISPKLDDLSSVYCLLEGFLASEEKDQIPMFCAFDNEECGNTTRQGAASHLLRDVLERIAACVDPAADTLSRLLAGSFLVSSDNGHALHPNHPEYSDKENAPVLGGGVVIKTNAKQRYATDGCSYALFESICQKAGCPTQTFANRSDLPGGTTLGAIAGVLVPVPIADIGLPQLAMHSCVETAHIDDVDALCRAMRVYHSSSIRFADGSICFA